jgi:hypothetical protein
MRVRQRKRSPYIVDLYAPRKSAGSVNARLSRRVDEVGGRTYHATLLVARSHGGGVALESGRVASGVCLSGPAGKQVVQWRERQDGERSR